MQVLESAVIAAPSGETGNAVKFPAPTIIYLGTVFLLEVRNAVLDPEP